MSEAFRQEVIENQKARVDLVKWKLIIVAAVFAWSLDKGASASQQFSFWAVALVPFICLFVDSQCFHINLRTFVIAQFLRDKVQPKDESQYEHFVHKLRNDLREGGGRQNAVQSSSGKRASLLQQVRQALRGDMFQLEQGVLTWSTLALCVFVFFWPNVTQSFGQNADASAQTAACKHCSPPVASSASPDRPSAVVTHPKKPKNKTGRLVCRVSGVVGLIVSSVLWWLYAKKKQYIVEYS